MKDGANNQGKIIFTAPGFHQRLKEKTLLYTDIDLVLCLWESYDY